MDNENTLKMMNLSQNNLKYISKEHVTLPTEGMLHQPERVLQFGTGMLLRGLPDYFIDKANRQGIFNGRIVVVKSTSKGDASVFDTQNGLYTVCRRGVSQGENVTENVVCSSISRVLKAAEDWQEILKCAHNPDMKVVISNTTERGLQLEKEDDVRNEPPTSFPGKLVAFLYERFKFFNGSDDSGMIIIPTELIPDNGKMLESIVVELAWLNGLEEEFIDWLENANRFCSSLVDRIVTGMPSDEERDDIFDQLGYTDDLLTVTEVYGLWAIEGDEKVQKALSFCKVNDEIKIEPNIDIYRELKLRLLNATHTFSSGTAFLAGVDMVKDAMNDEVMSVFIEDLMQEEISPSIPLEIDAEVKLQFIHDVQDRFRNPHLEHHWYTIANNYSQKIKLRCVPLIANHYKHSDTRLPLMTLGIAAWLTYTRPVKLEDGKYYGHANGEDYLIEDAEAATYFPIWQNNSTENAVKEILRNSSYWEHNLLSFLGFYEAVMEDLQMIQVQGVKHTLEQLVRQKSL